MVNKYMENKPEISIPNPKIQMQAIKYNILKV